jgi:hypothetical protein
MKMHVCVLGSFGPACPLGQERLRDEGEHGGGNSLVGGGGD